MKVVIGYRDALSPGKWGFGFLDTMATLCVAAIIFAVLPWLLLILIPGAILLGLAVLGHVAGRRRR